jgi:hypothetical protein
VKKNYVVRWANEALAPMPEPDWVIEKLIAKPGVIMWYGDSGSKKSYTQFHQALSIAFGTQWLSFPVKQQTVLIVDEENGEYRMRKRVGEILRGMGLDQNYTERIPLAWICDAHWNFIDEHDCETLAKEIIKLKAGYVLIDSFVDVLRGGDENSSKDTHRILQGIRDVSRASNCLISIIHHTNKKGGFRGSSNIKGEVDYMIEVESEIKSPNINFRMEKNRDGLPINFAAVAAWDEATDEFTLNGSTEIGKINAIDLYVLKCLARQKMTIETMSETAPSHIKDIKKLRNSVEKLRGLKRVGRSNKGNPALYELIEVSTKVKSTLDFLN